VHYRFFWILKWKIVYYNLANSWFWHTVALSRTTYHLVHDLLLWCVLYIYACVFFNIGFSPVVAHKTLIIFLITKDTSFACSAFSPTRKPSFLPASPFVRFFNRILSLVLHIYTNIYLPSYLYRHTVHTWGWNKMHIGF